nr:hypothetical protein [Tanacetum cinerariifolium]
MPSSSDSVRLGK